MNRIFVLDNQKQPLSPCLPARARMLLREGKAAVYRRFPFTIILKNRTGGETQPVELKLDPGSKTTGIALIAEVKTGKVAVFAAELNHRGAAIKKVLLDRRMFRRNRRARKTRYRAPRFDNRTRRNGWLPPSIQSRVDNSLTWAKRLRRLCPITTVAVETARFDMQQMENPDISGVEYQQGTLAGYELREYLLEKWGRRCAYCGAENVPLEIEHVVPRSKGGSNRESNLTLACRDCNEKKGNGPIREFLATKPELLKKILAGLKRPLHDAAVVNAARYALGGALKSLGLPVSFWSGGRTKFNRTGQHYPKAHWIDAACVGETGAAVKLDPKLQPFSVVASGRGSRQMCRMDKYGFPRTGPKGARFVKGFRTGDLVKAVVPAGKKTGTHLGRVAVRSTGSFNVTTAAGTIQGISHKYCRRLHRADGYGYTNKPSA
ncbi:RNA-guided endonuclease IscB [Geoalkalibacter subterraneus]|uniref:HNH endonuclease n=1 Tax=Geoalkalibacter subterraneus TaxID=483547 RepID=A0A0B5FVT5_9BACT|nr:RNA-guided endonuclease IscB [Geoalkalibacter subterraneus]AJF08260.1 HNH endonuclease [Geoalkalibacter subterraneus]